MTRFRNVPIQRKLRFVILATCIVALCVASTALFALQFYFFERDYRRDLVSVAEIIANLSAGVIPLDGAEQTQDFLDALASKPHIVGAFIRVQNGSVVSQYGRTAGVPESRDLASDGYHDHGGELIYAHPIMDGAQRLGTVYLVSDYRAQARKLQFLYASILMAVLALSFLVAAIVSSRLERVICGPIQALADTARRIASGSDYALRAQKEANDEVGQFTDTFNGMLEQIQNRDASLRHEISERVRAEQELQRVHGKLIDASRQAGMAEVATGVLHNVGNVLNSVNVSATLIAEKLGDSRSGNLLRAARLLREQNGSLADFLKNDPKGRLLPGYLIEAGEHIANENAETRVEVELLKRNIEHIKDIVTMQQSYDSISGVVEKVPLDDLVVDALSINADDMARHRVTIQRDYEPTPPAAVDKHKVLQILVNLLRNAKYAVDEAGDLERTVTIRIRKQSEQRVSIEVADTGIGIPAENLTRIFSHGFTTRQGGHGFGLHSAAIAAKEMNGELSAASPGPGLGATFTLVLPIAKPPAQLA